MTYWTHITTTLASNNMTDSYREFTLFNVPFNSTLRRTIVDASISAQRLFDPGTGQPPIYPVHWALGDQNSDVSPHLSDNPDAGATEGIPLIAHGQIAVVYSPSIKINDYNADTTNPPYPAHGAIHNAPDQEYVMWLSGNQHVDSHAQRTFPGVHPRIVLSILQATSGFPHDAQAPETVFSIRQLWS